MARICYWQTHNTTKMSFPKIEGIFRNAYMCEHKFQKFRYVVKFEYKNICKDFKIITMNIWNYTKTTTLSLNKLKLSRKYHVRRMAWKIYVTFGDIKKIYRYIFKREILHPWCCFNIANPNKPVMTLKSHSPLITIEFNPRDPSMLISGMMSGQVCNWDIRIGNRPAQISPRQFSHR